MNRSPQAGIAGPGAARRAVVRREGLQARARAGRRVVADVHDALGDRHRLVREDGAVLALARDRHVRAVEHDGRRALEAVVGRRVVVQRGVGRREVALRGQLPRADRGVDRRRVAGQGVDLRARGGRAGAAGAAPAGRAARDLDGVAGVAAEGRLLADHDRVVRVERAGDLVVGRELDLRATCRRVRGAELARPAQAAACGPARGAAVVRRPGQVVALGGRRRRRALRHERVELRVERLVVRVVDVVQEALGPERRDDLALRGVAGARDGR